MKKILITMIIVSIIASFYISEVLNMAPCLLCWIQRILVFIILIFALLNNKVKIQLIYPISILGMFIAFYHILMQTFNLNSTTCSLGKSNCGDIEFELFGFLTMPMLSFINFLIITILVYIIDEKN